MTAPLAGRVYITSEGNQMNTRRRSWKTLGVTLTPAAVIIPVRNNGRDGECGAGTVEVLTVSKSGSSGCEGTG